MLLFPTNAVSIQMARLRKSWVWGSCSYHCPTRKTGDTFDQRVRSGTWLREKGTERLGTRTRNLRLFIVGHIFVASNIDKDKVKKWKSVKEESRSQLVEVGRRAMGIHLYWSKTWKEDKWPFRPLARQNLPHFNPWWTEETRTAYCGPDWC